MSKPRTRKDMIAYLQGHYRYSTMNSWNRSSSYAVNVKVPNVVPKADQDAVYAMLEHEDAYDDSRFVFENFAAEHNGWCIGLNGRSSGYAVLYQCEYKPSQYKSRCATCHQRNFQPPEAVKACGRCRSEDMRPYSAMEQHTFPGRGTDSGEDFTSHDEWDMPSLRRRVDLVWAFDKAVKDWVEAFIYYAKEHKVETVTETRKVQVQRVVSIHNEED